MSRFNDNQNKYSKPCFPSSAGRIPNTLFIPISKAQIRTFRAIINDLIKITPKPSTNPSPKNIEDLIDTLNLLNKFFCSLDANSSLKAQGLAIIKNLITILKNPTFVPDAVFIELQILNNYLLYITRLFRIDPCISQEFLKLIAELQTTLVNLTSFDKGPTGSQGSQGETVIQGPAGSTGPQANTDTQGLAGSTGPQGNTGIQGPAGTTRAQSPQGNTGTQGLAGSTGPQGPQDDTVIQGLADSTGPTGSSFPVATILVTNNIQQTVLQFNNFIFSTAINVNNIIFNGTDTVTVINAGTYVIIVSFSTTAPECAPLGVGISINGIVATDNFSSNPVGDSLSFTTIETLAAGAHISVKSTLSEITIPQTGNSNIRLTVYRIA